MKWLILMSFCALMTLGKGFRSLPEETAKQCKAYTAQNYWKSRKIFNLYSQDRRQYKMAPDTQFEIHYAVQANDIAHANVLLSTVLSGQEDPNEKSYYVGFTPLNERVVNVAIREVTNWQLKIEKNVNDLLSNYEIRPFYVRMKKSGLLQFGRECEAPLLEWLVDDVAANAFKSYTMFCNINQTKNFLHDCPVITSATDDFLIMV